MIVKSGTTPACAACKYQRRKCSPACPLAPYFPANQPKVFENVHRLFGVSYVTKTLAKIKNTEDKEDAMRSIIYEAEMWDRFPARGCCFVIAQLSHQLELARQELNCVNSMIKNKMNDWEDIISSNSFDYMLDDVAPPMLSLNSHSVAFIQAQMDKFDKNNMQNIQSHVESKIEG